jgi:DNA-binding CsgD family transcriptional regulator
MKMRVGCRGSDGWTGSSQEFGEVTVDGEQMGMGTEVVAIPDRADISGLMPASASCFTGTLLGEDVLVIELPGVLDGWDQLTKAEGDIAELVLGGARNREIALARGCSVRTVANQLQSVLRKLGVVSRAELACCVAA